MGDGPTRFCTPLSVFLAPSHRADSKFFSFLVQKLSRLEMFVYLKLKIDYISIWVDFPMTDNRLSYVSKGVELRKHLGKVCSRDHIFFVA